MEHLNPPTMWQPVSPRAQISIAPAGRLAFIAGQVALDAQGVLVGADDYGEQARQCFRNLAAALDAIGADPAQMVQMSLYIVDHRRELRPVIFGAGHDVFGDRWPVCSSKVLGVATLSEPEWLIEIDAVVSLPAE